MYKQASFILKINELNHSCFKKNILISKIDAYICKYNAIKFQEEVGDYFKPPLKLKQSAKDFLFGTKSTKSQLQSFSLSTYNTACSKCPDARFAL